jgi:hypothetical protein
VQVGGDHAGTVDGEFDKPFFNGRRGDADGNFPFAGDGQLAKLTGLVCVFLFIAFVEEDEFERLQALVFGFDDNVINADRIG